jgi:hypothetical protein
MRAISHRADSHDGQPFSAVGNRRHGNDRRRLQRVVPWRNGRRRASRGLLVRRKVRATGDAYEGCRAIQRVAPKGSPYFTQGRA